MKVKIRIGNEVKEYTGAWEDHTLLEVFQELGITQVHAPCGGNGTCKKCLVTVEGLGEVLSCQTQCKDGMCVTVAEEQKSAIAENGNCYLYPADAGEGLLAACDIGTTTVVCHLLDGATGVRLCTVSAPNAQRSFGADVISRIQASVDSGLDKLQSAIVDQINGILYRSCAGIRSIVFCFVFVHLSGKQHSWEILLNRYLDERICLIIHEHGIVFGPMLLDQIALQNQSLQL